jgi:hypothetical protein
MLQQSVRCVLFGQELGPIVLFGAVLLLLFKVLRSAGKRINHSVTPWRRHFAASAACGRA